MQGVAHAGNWSAKYMQGVTHAGNWSAHVGFAHAGDWSAECMRGVAHAGDWSADCMWGLFMQETGARSACRGLRM